MGRSVGDSAVSTPGPPWSDRLIEYLQCFAVDARRDGDDLLIQAYGSRSFDPPARLRVDEDGLCAYLASMAEDAEIVFPDVPADVGAYRLLLTHVDEILETKLRPGVSVRFVPGESFVVVDGSEQAAPGPGRLAPGLQPGQYAWRPERWMPSTDDTKIE